MMKSESGVILIVMGLMLFVLHYQVGGSEFRDFCSGLMLKDLTANLTKM